MKPVGKIKNQNKNYRYENQYQNSFQLINDFIKPTPNKG